MIFPSLRQLAFFLIVFGFVPGCASLGLEKPQTFAQRVAYTLATITAARESATVALKEKRISADDAAHVQALANRVREGVDAARRLQDMGNTDSALARLRLAEGVLSELTRYLQARGMP